MRSGTGTQFLRGFVLATVLCLTGTALAATILRPVGKVETVAIGRTAKPYMVIGSDPVTIPLAGPGTITLYARVAMPDDETQTRKGTLTLAGLEQGSENLPLEFRRSRSSSWPDARPGSPSSGAKVNLDIPVGDHNLQLSSKVVGGGSMLVILYYEGPDQPNVPGLMAPVVAQASATKKKPKKKKSTWSFRGSFDADFMYNDNVLTNSPDDMADFLAGAAPYKFRIKSNDDFVLAPSLKLEARANLLDWGQTRFKFWTKRWMYAANPIKTNHDFHFYGRQYFGKGQSFEAYFHFAPPQYIGQLSDRHPAFGPDGPLEYPEFTFQRNVWNLTWRQKVSKKLDAKILYEENYRYYNQVFMENDIDAWEIRGQVVYKFNRSYRIYLDYSFEDAAGGAIDEIGETPIFSDNSDPSYERDLYRAQLSYRPRKFKYFDSIDFTYLFMDYYYTTDKTIVEDPYHAGRRDTYHKVTVDIKRKLTKNMAAKAAVRRTERIVYSPWEGDITTDKDFTQWLYWINLSYAF